MFSETPELRTFKPSFKRKLFSKDQLHLLKSGTLRLLKETGIHFPNQKALEIFSDHGAEVDMKKQHVKIRPDLVEKAVSSAPRSFLLAGRENRFDLHIDGSVSYHIPNSCGVSIVDPVSREKRSSTKSDLCQISRIFDSLPLINIVRPIIAAIDRGLTSALHECHAMLTNSLKHVRGGTSMHPRLAPYLVEMVKIVSGSDAEFRQRPIVNANICSLAPLAHDTHSIECALIYASAGMPVSIMAMPTICTTAPAAPMAALIVGEAEIISAFVLLQLAFPGTPVIHSNLVGLMDPLTARNILDVSFPVGTAAVQMAQDVWNVPSLGGVLGCINARDIGWETGMVDGQASILMNLDGADLPGFTCLLDDAMTVYPEHIILMHETLERAYELLHSFEFTEGDLAIKLIEKVGPRGHFLMEPHTAQNLRKIRHTTLLRQLETNGVELEPREVALKRYLKIADKHFPLPLSEEILQELNRLLDAADREAKKLDWKE